MKRYTNLIIIIITLIATLACVVIEAPYLKSSRDIWSKKYKTEWEQQEKKQFEEKIKDNKSEVEKILEKLENE